MPHRQIEMTEDTPLWTTKFLRGLISVAIGSSFSVGVAYTVFSMRQDSAEARITKIENDRSETLKVWQQERIESASFQSKVLTKLERIEQKLDK